jgi:hypothetical protein
MLRKTYGDDPTIDMISINVALLCLSASLPCSGRRTK